MAAVHALSLLGFMDDALANSYLTKICLLADSSGGALKNRDTAKGRLGPPIANAGHPEIRSIPVEHRHHLNGVESNPRYKDTIEEFKFDFGLVEIAPLLAFQFHVETERAGNLKGRIGATHTLPELLALCLPHEVEPIQYRLSLQPTSLMIVSNNLNLRPMKVGIRDHPEQPALTIAGVLFGPASPLVQVMRVDGRCYLRNGFHRAYLLQKLGVTHIPAVVLEGNDFSQVGAAGGEATFGRAILESDNPPTCSHLTADRAYKVRLRPSKRYITVTWTDYVMPEEG
jgi:hypothetical protein